MGPASIPACGGIELAVQGGLGAPRPPLGWWAPSLGWRSNRHPASALCGLPFLFLLCGIVAALRLLAVGWAVLCVGVDGLGMFGASSVVLSSMNKSALGPSGFFARTLCRSPCSSRGE